MFFPPSLPPTDEEKPAVQGTSKPHCKSRKKKKRKASIAKKKNKFGCTMSSWAENFTFAATWQLKHQLAFWKARAKSLEYENTILHEIIRKNCLDAPVTSSKPREFDLQNSLSSNHESESDKSETDEESCPEEASLGDELEVSEEFIQFLKENAKYKEDARREREKLKGKMAKEDIVDLLEAGPSKPLKSNSDQLKELYGANWQRIAALEMSVQSQFICECDKKKPVYWPNIPFNFNS